MKCYLVKYEARDSQIMSGTL